MHPFAAARIGLALIVGLWVIGSPAFAAGGHDHGHAHGQAKSAKASGAAQVMASSELFEFVGTLRDGRLQIRLTNSKDKSPVKDARVEVAIDGETALAAAQADGGYLLQTPALAKPGEHEVIATITAGAASDLLVGTLAPPHGETFDHDHADHHDAGGNAADTRLVALARRPLVALGAALGLIGLGLALGLRLNGRTTLARPLAGGALLIALASAVAGLGYGPRAGVVAPKASGHGHEHGGHKDGGQPEGVIEMSAERVAAARITVEPVGRAAVTRRLSVPGVVIPDAARQARVPAQVVGTVAEMRKRIGDAAARGEVIAVISSREVADAKSEYLAAVVNLDLQRTLYERSAALWEKRVTPEQQFLQVKATFAQAQLRVDLARQKLSSLGLDAKVVAQEAKEDVTSQGPSRLRTYEVRSPIAGRVVERKVDVGAPVGKEGDASELYVISDLTGIWVDLSVPLGDIDAVKEAQKVKIGHADKSAEGTIVFVSPVVNAETRSARVIAAFDNKELSWRPGTFVNAEIALGQQDVAVRVPRTSLQTIEGKTVVFVRTAVGFEKREVTLGKSDADAVEVTSGLDAGTAIAVSNTFVLKADLGKSEAEHSH